MTCPRPCHPAPRRQGLVFPSRLVGKNRDFPNLGARIRNFLARIGTFRILLHGFSALSGHIWHKTELSELAGVFGGSESSKTCQFPGFSESSYRKSGIVPITTLRVTPPNSFASFLPLLAGSQSG